MLRRAAAWGPDRPGLFFEDEVWTFSMLDEAANRAAHALDALGVRRGERVAVLMANRAEYFFLLFAVGRLGAVFVPVVTRCKPPELEYYLEHSEATALILDRDGWETLERLRRAGRAPSDLRTVIVVGDDAPDRAASLKATMGSAPADAWPESATEDDVYAFMYSSGTTGRPKAIVHTHHIALAQAAAITERLGYTPADRLMTVFPMFHGDALIWSGLTATYACAAFILTERFSASRFWTQVHRYGATEVNLAATVMNILLARPPGEHERDHGLRFALASFTEPIHSRFTERFGVDLVTLWALAEGPLGTMAAPGFGYKPGLVGWPMGVENEIRVVDDDGDPLPDGEVGELVQRNSAIMLRYNKDPEATRRALRDGWLHTGDLGYRGDDGLFYFLGRKKLVVRRGEENVSVEEVESCIAAHPQVVDAAVIPVPDELRGEEVKALVMAEPGSRLTEAEIVTWVQERLVDFKIPRYIEFRESLPRTQNDQKFDYAALKAEPGLTDCWDRRDRPDR